MKIINSQVQIFNPRVILPFLELMMRTLFLTDGGFYMLDTHAHTLPWIQLSLYFPASILFLFSWFPLLGRAQWSSETRETCVFQMTDASNAHVFIH